MATREIKEKYIIWKNLGETPLEALTRLREEVSIPSDVPMTYAGRLDPAAEGFLIVLTGEECKKKETYSSLTKTYMAEILVDVSTDSYDLLGIPNFDGEAKNILKNCHLYPNNKYLLISDNNQLKTTELLRLRPSLSPAGLTKKMQWPVYKNKLYFFLHIVYNRSSTTD